MKPGYWKALLLVTVVICNLVLVSRLCVAGKYLEVADASTTVYNTEYKGAIIHHKLYKIVLEAQTVNVPLFTVFYEGAYQSGRERAENIVQHLEHAFDLLSNTTLSTSIVVKQDFTGNLGLWAVEKGDYYAHGHYIMTVYPQDIPFYCTSKIGLDTFAQYIRALIRAHYTMSFRCALRLSDYENLDIVSNCTSGKIFRKIYKEVNYTLELGIKENSIDRSIDELQILPKEEKMSTLVVHFQKGLDDIPEEQRRRLHLLAFRMPHDWR